MNLQICTPYRKCPFNCPMCIASKAPKFNNLYGENFIQYFLKLDYVLEHYPIKTVVLTGDTEPTLDLSWVFRVSSHIKERYPHINIELQTHVYGYNRFSYKYIDRVCYSITDSRYLNHIVDLVKSYRYDKNHEEEDNPIPTKSRLVFLATKELITSLTNLKRFVFDAEQITFKILQNTAYSVNNIDYYIKNNKASLHNTQIKKLIQRYKKQGKSVVLDINCQDAKDRYMVFREDGFTYKDWSSLKPEFC